MNPPPAAVSAVTAAPAGPGSGVCVQVAPPSVETAANGSRSPAAVTSVPAAATVPAPAATYRSSALRAEPGSGSGTSDQARPVADSHAAARGPSEPTATKSPLVAATAFICRSPAPSRAPGWASAARRQPVRPGACQAAAITRPPDVWCPTITYPPGPAAAAAVTRPRPVNAAAASAAVHVRPSADPTTTGRSG